MAQIFHLNCEMFQSLENSFITDPLGNQGTVESMYGKLVNGYKIFNAMDFLSFNNPLFNTSNWINAIEKHNNNSRELVSNFINLVNAESKKSKTIVFVAGRCYPMMAREAHLLKKKGYKTFLINMESFNQNDMELLAGSFDEIIQNCLFFPFLKKILNSITPTFYHVQSWMWNYSLGKFIIENKGISKVINEFYDVTGMYADSEKLKLNFWDQIVDLDLDCEKFIFENSDGIIHRYKQDIFLKYSKKYCSTKNIFEFQQYPLTFHQKINKSKRRLVYCGTMIGPNDKKHPRKLFPTAGMSEAFESLIFQDFEINVYLPLNGSMKISDFNKWIFELKEKHPSHFRIHNTLPISKLVEEMSHYDFALNLSVIDKKNSYLSDYTFEGGMGTKQYTYLEAGLPIITNKEYSYMSDLVENNKIGLSLNSNQISNTKKLVENLNIYELKNNVKKFYDENNIWKKGKELEKFYSSLE